MRKTFLAILATVCMQATASAATGDSTWVQAHSDIWLGASPANFDTTVQFPDGSKSYRRVVMVFTLGKYQCPGTPQYCGDWDYTVNSYLMTKNGDTVELGRLITPYASTNAPRTPMTWKERYVYDVTDFYPLLKDSATVRISYSGYSGGFTANIKFVFVEGTPARNVAGVERLWHGYFGYGNAANPIDNKITAFSKTAPANTQTAEMKFNISGHGSDGTGCAEFCKKYYNVMLNSSQVEQKQIWRDNCGSNNLYPQSGTWVYDRGNWCPGALVNTNNHKLPGVSASSNYTLDVDFESYTDNGNAGYGIDACVVYYGGFNKTLDASLDDIVAPNNHEMYFRQNPHTGGAIVHVKNTGSTTITSIKFEYGIVGGTYMPVYTWQGSLSALAEADIELPEPWDMRNASGTNQFTAKIQEVNGQADGDASNNNFTSTFVAAPQWPMTIIVNMQTNKGQQSGGNSETEWKIYSGNTVVAQRTNTAITTSYSDTVNLGPGFYKLVVEDAGCDGLNWWANTAAGSGYIQVRRLTSAIALPMSGYFSADFGCGFTQYFNVTFPTSVVNVNENGVSIEAYPNPAANSVTVSLGGLSTVKGTMQLIDMMGRVVYQQKCTGLTHVINTADFANGNYVVVFTDENTGNSKLKTRLTIAK